MNRKVRLDKIRQTAIFTGILLFVIIIGAYRKGEESTSAAEFSILDAIKAENILKSPFQAGPEKNSSGKAFPARSREIGAAEAGENPLGLKRKLRTNFNTNEIDTLFAPPHSLYSLEIDPGPSRLSFGIGIIKNGISVLKIPFPRGSAGVLFRILLETDAQKKVIFSKSLEAPPPDAARGEEYSEEDIELPPRHKTMRILLETIGAGDPQAFWFDPVLYTPRPKARKIILISLDTLRADHLGCYGYSRNTSPALDALARDSALFLGAHALSAWTLPSHVSLFTGLEPGHHGVRQDRDRMDPSLPTLPALLRANHFICAAFTGGVYLSPSYGYSKGFGLYNEMEGIPHTPNAAGRTADAAIGWLERNAGKDALLFIHTYQIHDPYAPPEPFNESYLDADARWKGVFLHSELGGFKGYYRNLGPAARANIVALYDAQIRYTDEALIKPIVDFLKAKNLFDETMIILTADHGEQFEEHGAWGHMNDLYEESLHVPLLIKFPKGRFTGARIQSPVRLTDIAPTICDAYGLPLEALDPDGASLIPLLQGREKSPRPVYASVIGNVNDSHFPAKSALLWEPYKLILNEPLTPRDLAFFDCPPPPFTNIELYNLNDDPGERINIAARFPEIVRRLEAKLTGLGAKAKLGSSFKLEMDENLREKMQSLGYVR
jgi:hypothetical protein